MLLLNENSLNVVKPDFTSIIECKMEKTLKKLVKSELIKIQYCYYCHHYSIIIQLA